MAANLPALLRAHKLQKRAARVGFDWPDASHVLAKITEEAAELEEARDSMDADALEDEFGDLLFVMVNLGRHLGIEPEAALRRTNAKFTRRFEQVEARLAARGAKRRRKAIWPRWMRCGTRSKPRSTAPTANSRLWMHAAGA